MKRSGNRASSAARVRASTATNGGSRRPAGRRLDPAVEAWFAAVAADFASSRASIIPMLQSAQGALGYLPADAMQVIARHIRVPAAVVAGVASFYAQFRFHKPGRHRVTVCSGTACYVRGSGKLMEDLQTELRIAAGKTTADGEVSLDSVSCFGACALAPVVVLNDKVLRQQTSASIKKAMADLAAGKPKRVAGRTRKPSAGRGQRK